MRGTTHIRFVENGVAGTIQTVTLGVCSGFTDCGGHDGCQSCGHQGNDQHVGGGHLGSGA